MKKKWMKILLIINMFLCLFGVHEFASKSSTISQAANTKTIYAEITYFSGDSNYKWYDYYLWAWGNGTAGTDYKGTLVSGTDNLYVFNINPDHNSILFHKGIGAWNGANKTDDRTDFGNINYFVVKPRLYSNEKLYFDTTAEKCVESQERNNIYFDLTNVGWTNPNIYLWTDGTKLNNSWPGVKLSTIASKIGNTNLYKATTFTGIYTHLIINDGGSSQTVNFQISSLDNNNHNCCIVESETVWDDTEKKYKNKTGSKQVYEIVADVEGNTTTAYVSTIPELTTNINPSKNYHSFSGWYTASGTTPVTTLSTSLFPNFSGKLYARFVRIQQILTIIDDELTSKYNVNQGSTIQENISSISPRGKEGHTFKHWSTSSTGTEVNGSTLILNDITLYAVYEKIKYNVTYHYGRTESQSSSQLLDYGTNILLNVPRDAHENGYKISWYFDQGFVNEVTSSSTVNGILDIYAKYTKINYKTIYLDLTEFTGWTFSNSYFDMYYSSTEKVSETYSSILTKGEIVDVGNKFYRFKIDEIYSSFVIRTSDKSKQSEKISLLTDSTSGQKTKYIRITNSTRIGTPSDGSDANGKTLYKIKTENKLGNLLKTQTANISGDLDMYRFTMGATDSSKLYGFEFVFINDSSSVIRYWNFSND